LIATQGRLFSQIGDACYYCSSLSSPSDTTRSLSAEGHSRSDNNTRSLLTRSLARSLCSDVPVGRSRSPPPSARALRIALNFSRQKVGAATGRPATCTTAKGANKRRLRRHPKQTPPCPLPLGISVILRAVAVAATPPPILLLGRARLIESPRPSGN
jgi:hypothetical protein